jgi:hypothetical protein
VTELFQPNLIAASVDERMLRKNKTPGDVGDCLFESLLRKSSRSSWKDDWGFRPYEDSRLPRRTSEDYSDKDLDPVEALQERLADLGLPIGQYRLPGSVRPQLAHFLSNQGLSRERIDQLILSVTDGDGFIHLGRLMAQLQKIGIGDAISRKHLLIEARDVPRLQELLFNMGLGAGGVKEMVEKAVNHKGDLDLDRLSAALGKFFPDPASKEGLISLLEHRGIRAMPENVGQMLAEPDLRQVFRDSYGAHPEDIQKTIKQNISALLREKGIPPEEVKAFLETLAVESAGSLTKKFNPVLAGLSKDQQQAPAAYLFNRVVIRSQQGSHKGGWHEKIMEILREEELLITRGDAKNWFQEDLPIRMNVSELLRKGDQRARPPLFHATAVFEKKQSPDVKGNQQKDVKGPMAGRYDFKGGLQGQEALGNDFAGYHIEKNAVEASSAAHLRNPNNLPHPLPKILDRMIWMLRAGEQKSRILISPPELGRLDLDLVIKQGHLQANLSAETLQVKELIEANLGQLKQQLIDQGFVVDKFEVMIGLNDRGFPEGESRTARGWRDQSSKKPKRTETAPAMETKMERSSISNLHGIDMHV